MHIYCKEYRTYHIGIATLADGRKTTSIGAQTWERLKKFGEFGESFDDILK